jgi:uncharacterized repeat protein (TIGR03943 family)
MIIGGGARSYLAPWNTKIVAVGGALLAAIFILSFIRPVHSHGMGKRVNFEEWIITGSHFIPLALFVIVGPTMPNFATMRHAAFMPYAPTKQSDESSPIKAKPGEYLSVSIADLRSAPERYEGEPIEALGIVHVLGDEERGSLPSSAAGKNIQVLLYRYVITCCVADAVPLSAVLGDVEPKNVKEDAWCKVRGHAHYEGGELNVPFIKVESIEPVPTPPNPYLSGTDELFR